MENTDHVGNELELILSLFDEFLDLAATNPFLDGFPVLLLFAHAQPVFREALHRLAVTLVFWNLLDLLQRLAVESDQHLPRVRHHLQPHDPRRSLNLRHQRPRHRT